VVFDNERSGVRSVCSSDLLQNMRYADTMLLELYIICGHGIALIGGD